MTKIAVIGSGIGGLVAAMLLAARGHGVVVCEAADRPGGKLREMVVGGTGVDAGPTVFTLRPVFEAIFAEAGLNFADELELVPLDCLARHAWEDGSRLDLFADVTRSAAAIGEFAGAAAAQGYLEFAARAKKIFETLDASFMQIPQPGLRGLVLRAGPGVMGISPFSNMWGELARYFKDPRLRQLFARYATYCGSSPFSAPATLMLIAHAEQRGVWRIEGGMYRLAEVFYAHAARFGTKFIYGARVTEVLAQGGRATGVRLAGGETVAADVVIANADLAALDAGLLGAAAKQAVAGMMKGAVPSLSAVTWAFAAEAEGFDLAHHNVFFSKNYPLEFRELAGGKLAGDPTVYICAPGGGKYFLLVNAAAGSAPQKDAVQNYLGRVLAKLERSGLRLKIHEQESTGPWDFAQKFPATGGALYGRALEGWKDSFNRPGARTKLPGLLLAGGSVHPGPGLPMAAISGRIAAHCVLTAK